MQYEEFKNGIKLSKLGLGAMRLPQAEPGLGKPIDLPKAQALIDTCMAQGVNYYDTAYIYHGGSRRRFWDRPFPVIRGRVTASPTSSISRPIRITGSNFKTSWTGFR